MSERQALRAGPWALTLEDGDLRWLRLGGVEVVRRVYATVRDRAWNTYQGRIAKLEREIAARSFRIAYAAEHAGTDPLGERIAFRARAEIRGESSGEIAFSWEAECLTDCQSNRVGMCLLHPASGSGQPCTVEHVDGRRSEGAFPQLIAPWQPFVDLRAITTRPLAGVEVEARLEGDTFEMEDQRNWADGSFKIYSRPLGLPYPFTIRRGERFRQSVTLRVRGRAPEPTPMSRELIVIGETGGPLPEVGVRIDGSESTAVADRLRQLAPEHLRIDLSLVGDWRARWDGAMTVARSVGCGIEAAVTCSDGSNAELSALAAAAVGAPVRRWILLVPGHPTPAELVARARAGLSSATPGAAIGGGVANYFTALNRERPTSEHWDLLAFEMHPQVHASDSSSLVENLDGLPPVIASARVLAPGAAIALSLTLNRPGRGDPRQASSFAAAWTVGALARLGGARSATCFAATGVDGILEADGTPRPVGRVLGDVLEVAGAELLRVDPGDPLTFAALALRRGGRTRILVANLAPQAMQAELRGSVIPGGSKRLALEPYAVARFDC